MKNTIIKYGLISGALSAGGILIITLIFKSYGFDKVGFENSAYIGYSLIILSMAVIFFGIKAYRDNENDGQVSFKNGLLIGLGIALISCICYSLMWMVVYYNFMPNFMDDYADFSIKKLKESGAVKWNWLKTKPNCKNIKTFTKHHWEFLALH